MRYWLFVGVSTLVACASGPAITPKTSPAPVAGCYELRYLGVEATDYARFRVRLELASVPAKGEDTLAARDRYAVRRGPGVADSVWDDPFAQYLYWELIPGDSVVIVKQVGEWSEQLRLHRRGPDLKGRAELFADFGPSGPTRTWQVEGTRLPCL